MKADNQKPENGFMALTTVIILSAILLILSALVSRSAFYARANVLDYENKKISSAMAEACVQTALVKLAQDPLNYPSSIPAAGTQITVDSGKTCRICSLALSGSYTLKTRAVYNNAYTNITVVGSLGASNFTVSSWQETASGPSGCNLP